MDNLFKGKTVTQWIDLLRSGHVHERCAAALALAEIGPKMPPAKDALLVALRDVERTVQVAAQIAIGFTQASAVDRRRMVDLLLGNDENMRKHTLGTLDDVAIGGVFNSATASEEIQKAFTSPVRQDGRAPVLASASPLETVLETPDIEMVHVFPWWFLVGAVALCLVLGWLLRGVWWSKWAMAGFTALACVFLVYTRTRQQAGKLSIARYRARARIAWSAIFATLCGVAIGLVFPVATVIIDNESGAKVRIFLDGEEWHTSASGESKSKALAAGKYRVSIQDAAGKTLDEHLIEVSAYRQYILNVFGAQVYFQGVIQYGINGGETKIVTEKWLQVPDVDYLFRDPPQVIKSVNPVNKSFFTRGAPPKLRGG